MIGGAAAPQAHFLAASQESGERRTPRGEAECRAPARQSRSPLRTPLGAHLGKRECRIERMVGAAGTLRPGTSLRGRIRPLSLAALANSLWYDCPRQSLSSGIASLLPEGEPWVRTSRRPCRTGTVKTVPCIDTDTIPSGSGKQRPAPHRARISRRPRRHPVYIPECRRAGSPEPCKWR